MNIQHHKAMFAGLLLMAAPCMATAATPAGQDPSMPDKAAGPAQEDKHSCHQCGTIEAITQRILPAGINGYYTYNVHVRMDKTQLLRVVPATMRGTLDVGDRVQVMGGVIQPAPPGT